MYTSWLFFQPAFQNHTVRFSRNLWGRFFITSILLISAFKCVWVRALLDRSHLLANEIELLPIANIILDTRNLM